MRKGLEPVRRLPIVNNPEEPPTGLHRGGGRWCVAVATLGLPVDTLVRGEVVKLPRSAALAREIEAAGLVAWRPTMWRLERRAACGARPERYEWRAEPMLGRYVLVGLGPEPLAAEALRRLTPFDPLTKGGVRHLAGVVGRGGAPVTVGFGGLASLLAREWAEYRATVLGDGRSWRDRLPSLIGVVEGARVAVRVGALGGAAVGEVVRVLRDGRVEALVGLAPVTVDIDAVRLDRAANDV